jgi:hypothetical protein
MGDAENVGTILIKLWDGTRHLLAGDPKKLFTSTVENPVHGARGQSSNPGPEIQFSVEVFDGPDTAYTANVSHHGYYDAGYFPVEPKAGATVVVDLMMLPKKAKFDFAGADWASLHQKYPKIASRLSAGFASPDIARANYERVMKDMPKSLACFFNITTAMDQIQLAAGSALDYLVDVIWDDPKKRAFAQDRFFGHANADLIKATEDAAKAGVFGPEFLPWLFHPGANISFKQVQFGEANVQLTFHELENGLVVLEPDIDYFQDVAAHAILEVVPNKAHQTLTDPEQVYILHWIASKMAGLDYSPPYVIDVA